MALTNTYTVVDPASNYEFKYSSDAKPTLRQSFEIVEAGKIKAQDLLQSGRFTEDPLGNELTTDEASRKLSDLTALLMGVDKSLVSTNSALSKLDRMELGMRPTADMKFKFLKERFGENNLQAVNAGGTYRFLINKGDGYAFANEYGFDAGDLTSFLGAAAIPVLGSVAAVYAAPSLPVVGAAMAAGGTTSAATTAAVSGLGYFGSAVAQDSVISMIDKSEVNFREIIPRRGKEAPLALMFEFGFLKAAQGIRGLAAQGGDDITRALNSSVNSLNKEFRTKIQVATGGRNNLDGIAADQAATQNSPAMIKMMQRNAEELEKINNAMISGSTRPIEEVLEQSSSFLKSKIDKLRASADQADRLFAQSLENVYQTQLKRIGGVRESLLREPIGKNIQSSAQAGFNAARTQKRKLYERANALADEEALVYSIPEVLRAMRSAIREGGIGLKDIDEGAMAAFMSSVEKAGITDAKVLEFLRGTGKFQKDFFKSGKYFGDRKLLESMTYRQLDDIIKKYTDRADFSRGIAAGDIDKDFAKLMRKKLARVRDRRLFEGGTGKPLNETGKAVRAANKFYNDKYGLYLRPEVRPLIQPTFGSSFGNSSGVKYYQATPKESLAKVLADETNLKEYLKVFPDTPAGNAAKEQILKQIRTAYLDDIGFNGVVKVGQSFGSPKPSPDMLKALYGKNFRLKEQALESLYTYAKMTGKQVLEVDDAAFKAILKGGTPAQIKKAKEAAKAAIDRAKELDDIVSNKLIDDIINGGKTGSYSTEDALAAIGSLFNVKSTEKLKQFIVSVEKTSGKAGLNSLRRKLNNELLEMARPKGGKFPNVGGRPLFDGKELLRVLEKPNVVRVVKEVMGKEYLENMKNLARVAEYSTPKFRKAGFPGLRPVVSLGGDRVNVTNVLTDLPAAIARLAYGKMATTKGIQNLLIKRGKDQASKEAAALHFKEMIPYLTLTKDGIKSMLEYGDYDPSATIELERSAAIIGDENKKRQGLGIR